MNKIDRQLQLIKHRKTIGLMTHVVVGYPTLADTETIVHVMEKTGVDFIELQIPFSDPLADGPTIMKACEASLAHGTKVKDAFVLATKLSKQIQTPLLFMSYYNTVCHYGVEKFCEDAKKAGVSGLIVPDMPLEEEHEEHFTRYAEKNNLVVIRVISPAATEARLRKNAKVAKGFVYCTARQGITGAKDALSKDLAGYLAKVKKYFSIPIAVGFGISKREHVVALEKYADIAVIGSAVIDVIARSQKENMEENVSTFLTKLKMIE